VPAPETVAPDRLAARFPAGRGPLLPTDALTGGSSTATVT
jgi:hypothetical protein